MTVWINLTLNFVLAGLIIAGLIQVTRLITHLSGLKQGRMDMERFVKEFNAVVGRAESGIRDLKMTARESGNDLERLVERAASMRDELHYLVEAADKIAARLSNEASNARTVPAQAAAPVAKPAVASRPASATVTSLPAARKPVAEPPSASQASRAERELMQALEKLG